MAVPTRNIGFRTGGFRGVPGRGGELKWVDTSGSAAATSAGAVVLLNGLVPGTGSTQRIGRHINMKSLIAKATVGCGTAGATPFRGRLKMSIVYDSQTNATTPSFSDIYDTSNANSNLNLNNRGRFKVLWKKSWSLDQSGGLGSGYCENSRRLAHAVIYNAGTAGTVADIQTGGLFLTICTQQTPNASPPTNYPDYTYSFRIRYSDD